MGKRTKKNKWQMTPAQQRQYEAKKLVGKGRTDNDVASIRQALVIFREGLENDDTDFWNHHHVGVALREIGERTDDVASLQAALIAYGRAAELVAQDPACAPGKMAHATQAEPLLGLARTHFALGQREAGTTHLEAAISRFDDALRIADAAGGAWYLYGGMDIPIQANAMALLAQRTGDRALAQRAANQLQDCLDMFEKSVTPAADALATDAGEVEEVLSAISDDSTARRNRERADHLRADVARVRAVLAGLTDTTR